MTDQNQYKCQNLNNILSISTWNFRGLRHKNEEVKKVSKEKNIDICSFHETKTDENEEDLEHYEKTMFKGVQSCFSLIVVINSLNSLCVFLSYACWAFLFWLSYQISPSQP